VHFFNATLLAAKAYHQKTDLEKSYVECVLGQPIECSWEIEIQILDRPFACSYIPTWAGLELNLLRCIRRCIIKVGWYGLAYR
jgi:hypothetical protein